jgi:hypothetical protein
VDSDSGAEALRDDLVRLQIVAAFLASQIEQELRDRQRSDGRGRTTDAEEPPVGVAATDKGASSSPTASPGGREPLAS